jgi:hypothetical protein
MAPLPRKSVLHRSSDVHFFVATQAMHHWLGQPLPNQLPNTSIFELSSGFGFNCLADSHTYHDM